MMRPSKLSLLAPLAFVLMTSACEVAAPVEAHAQPPVIAAAPQTDAGAASAPTAQPVVEYECGMARQARLERERRWFKWPF